MSDRDSISKISSVKDSSNVYDKSNLRKKNSLYTEWNFPNQKGSSKNNNLMKNKKHEKKGYENNLLDEDRKSTRLNSSHLKLSRMPSSA